MNIFNSEMRAEWSRIHKIPWGTFPIFQKVCPRINNNINDEKITLVPECGTVEAGGWQWQK